MFTRGPFQNTRGPFHFAVAQAAELLFSLGDTDLVFGASPSKAGDTALAA